MRQSRENMHHTHMHRNLCIIQMTPKLCLKHWGRLNSRQVRVNQKTNDFRNTQREGRLILFATTAYRPVSPVTNLVDSLQKQKQRHIVCLWQTMNAKIATVQTASSLDVPSGHELHGGFWHNGHNHSPTNEREQGDV